MDYLEGPTRPEDREARSIREKPRHARTFFSCVEPLSAPGGGI